MIYNSIPHATCWTLADGSVLVVAPFAAHAFVPLMLPLEGGGVAQRIRAIRAMADAVERVGAAQDYCPIRDLGSESVLAKDPR